MKSILSLSSLFLFFTALTSITWASSSQNRLTRELVKMRNQLRTRYQNLQTELRLIEQKTVALDSESKTSIEVLQREQARIESRYASRVSDEQWLSSADQANLDKTFENQLGVSLLQGPVSLELSRRYIAWAIHQLEKELPSREVEHLAKQRKEKTTTLKQLQYVASRLGVVLEASQASDRKPASQSSSTVSH